MAYKKGCIPWNKGLKGVQSGEKHPMYGKHHKEESKQILRDKLMGRPGYRHVKGSHFSCETEFKKRHIPISKGKTKADFPNLVNSGHKKGCIAWNKDLTMPDSCSKKLCDLQLELWKDPIYAKMMSDAHKGQKAWNKGLTKETDSRVKKGGENSREGHQRNWRDPVYIENQRVGRSILPNKPESLVKMITGEYFTGFKYTGDLSVIINGKNPDFVNEETKQIIEVYGDYWHDGEDPTDRAEIFAQAGYETCVIWENELQNLDHVIGKLKRFMRI